LYVTDGSTLNILGTKSGGQVDELRLLSTDDKIINLRGHGGSLYFDETRVMTLLMVQMKIMKMEDLI